MQEENARPTPAPGEREAAPRRAAAGDGKGVAGGEPGSVVTPAGALSHLAPATDGSGSPEARMVDVGRKPATDRSALARARLQFPAGALAAVLAGAGPKGPIQEVARVAGILAAKRTGELIPMCHPLALDHVEIAFEALAGDLLEVRCRASCHGPTGVEMEAMTGASVAALTVYDMTKALDKSVRIVELALVEKRGGRSGTWRAAEDH